MSAGVRPGARVPDETLDALQDAGTFCVEQQLAAEEAAEREQAWANAGDELAARRRGMYLLAAAIWEQRSYEVGRVIERMRGEP